MENREPPSRLNQELSGATGTTGDLNLNSSSCASSEQSSAKKTQKPSQLTNRKQPNIKLAIDIVSINNQFNFGGEKGELKPEELESKLESDIMELAAKCVAAMRRAKKHKPRTRFNQLLAQELQFDDDQDDEQEIMDEDDDADEEIDDDEEDQDEEECGQEREAQIENTPSADKEDRDEEGMGEVAKTHYTDENKVEELMNMALAEDTLKIRGGNDLAQYMDNMSHDA